MVLPVFALLVFGTIDLARAYRLDIRLEAAAREGAGFAQVRPNDVRCSGAFDDVFDFALAEDPSLADHPGFDLEVLSNGGELAETCRAEVPTLAAQVDSGDKIKVRATANFEVLTPLVSNVVGKSITMTSTADVRAQ